MPKPVNRYSSFAFLRWPPNSFAAMLRATSGTGETRKRLAILVSDVVGYSRLAAADEERTLARLRALRSDLIDPAIALHHGRIVKRTGDGSIIEFRSVVDAVWCAIEVQQGLIERNAGLPSEKRKDASASGVTIPSAANLLAKPKPGLRLAKFSMISRASPEGARADVKPSGPRASSPQRQRLSIARSPRRPARSPPPTIRAPRRRPCLCALGSKRRAWDRP
jgi:hypothetical protein